MTPEEACHAYLARREIVQSPPNVVATIGAPKENAFIYRVSIEGLPHSEGIKQRWIPGCPAQASHLDPDFWESDYGT